MTDLKSILKLPHGLATFGSKELYYIISNLFELGAFGEHFIEKERLYLNFDGEDKLKFIFICTTPILSDTDIEPSTAVYFGQFDEEFEEIEIYSGSVPFTALRADNSCQIDGLWLSELFADAQRVSISPVRLVNGLVRLIEATNLKTRKRNDSFFLIRDDLPKKYQQYFNLHGQYQIQKDSHKDFSGFYYLVAEPASSFDDDNQELATIIYEYILSEDERYSIEEQVMDTGEMARWENLEFKAQ